MYKSSNLKIEVIVREERIDLSEWSQLVHAILDYLKLQADQHISFSWETDCHLRIRQRVFASSDYALLSLSLSKRSEVGITVDRDALSFQILLSSLRLLTAKVRTNFLAASS